MENSIQSWRPLRGHLVINLPAKAGQVSYFTVSELLH